MAAQADGSVEVHLSVSPVVSASEQFIGLLLNDKRVKFVLTGALNTVFGFVCFAFYQYLVGMHVGYMTTLVFAHCTTVLFAFMTHRRLVFDVSGSVIRDLWRFESVNLVVLGINALLLPLAVEVAGLPVLAAQAAITVLNALVSWLGHSRFSFSRSAADS
ncbi:GtrA family protein [Terrabacter carboxydivorans]|uniref:GtrA/DPMS transmembrane domain-containing protein n=1 Tax=Terrabacter carboxydivorans TaxID=619730 RepID=A0ABP5Z0R3_9MICO